MFPARRWSEFCSSHRNALSFTSRLTTPIRPNDCSKRPRCKLSPKVSTPTRYAYEATGDHRDVHLANKKRQGRPPAVLKILMMVELFLVYGLLELCPRGKLGDLAGGYLDRCAGLWIAAVTRFSLRHGERAEANQRHAIPFAECRRNAVNGGINGGRGLRLARLACACDLVNQIGFIHSFSSQVSFMPSPDREANWQELSWET